MNKKKLLSLIVLVALLFVLVTPLLYTNQANVAKADIVTREEMHCDCIVPYHYRGGRLWVQYCIVGVVWPSCWWGEPVPGAPCEDFC